MTVYNKLKIAILAIISSQTFAISIDPIQVQSGSGDLLYAEMKFRHSDPNVRIEVGLAEADDLMSMGVAHQPPGHLNFFTRRTGDGSGVIVITSSRPVVDAELNILLKIKEGSATHIQQIKTSLKRSRPAQEPTLSGTEKALIPQVIVSENDIQLNLPSTAQYRAMNNTAPVPISTHGQSNTSVQLNTPVAISITPLSIAPSNTIALVTQKIAPPPMNSAAIASPQKTHVTVFTPPNIPVPVTQQATLTTVQPEIKAVTPQQIAPPSPQAEIQKEVPKPTAQPAPEVPKETAQQAVQPKPAAPNQQNNVPIAPVKNMPSDSKAQHVVQANESLWKISSRIASQSNQSVPEVMRQIKANNEHAFIQGDINRIRRGVALNLAAAAPPVAKTPTTQKPVLPPTTQKQSGKAKYRLGQDEMSLVAGNSLDAAHGK